MSGANDRQIIRWSMQDFSPVESESVPSKPICCTFDRTEDRFVFGTEAGMLGFRSWRAPNLHQDVIASSSPIRSVAISADGSTVASGCQDGNVSLWNTETGLKLVDFPAEQSSQSAVLSLSFSHDNEVIAAGLYSGAVITSENTTATR
jgi:WD40 repeat protein